MTGLSVSFCVLALVLCVDRGMVVGIGVVWSFEGCEREEGWIYWDWEGGLVGLDWMGWVN